MYPESPAKHSRMVEAFKLFKKLQNCSVYFEGMETSNSDPLSFQLIEPDLRLLRSKFWRDTKVNILTVVAFFLNPYSGTQILINLWKLDISKFDNLSAYNKQVLNLFPLIILDWISIGLFVLLLALNALIGNLRPCVLILRKLFGKSCNDPRLSWVKKSTILFENIWYSISFFAVMIYKVVRNLLLYPIAVFSPKEFKEFRKFDEENWFELKKYNQVSKYVFGVFIRLFLAKYKLLIRKLSKDEKKIKTDLIKLIDAEIWDKACVQQWIEAEEFADKNQESTKAETSQVPAPNETRQVPLQGANVNNGEVHVDPEEVIN